MSRPLDVHESERPTRDELLAAVKVLGNACDAMRGWLRELGESDNDLQILQVDHRIKVCRELVGGWPEDELPEHTKLLW